MDGYIEQQVASYRKKLTKVLHELIQIVGDPKDNLAGKRIFWGTKKPLSKSTEDILCKIYNVDYIICVIDDNPRRKRGFIFEPRKAYFIQFGPKKS
jgi:hypothetical protein